jgi:hypothetical protein
MYPLKGTSREKNRLLYGMCQATSWGRNMGSVTSQLQSGGPGKAAPGRLGSLNRGWAVPGIFCVYRLLVVGVLLLSAHVQGMEPSICRDCLQGRWASSSLQVPHPQEGTNSDLVLCLDFSHHTRGRFGRPFEYSFVGGLNTKKSV